MTTIFEIHLDSFKYSYTGYWSSIEKACEMLPTNKKFLESLSWNTPKYDYNKETNVSYQPDYEHNKNIKPVLKYDKERAQIEVYLPGFKVDVKKRTVIPEVKEAGKPYEPEKYIDEILEPKIIDNPISWAYVRSIEVDQNS